MFRGLKIKANHLLNLYYDLYDTFQCDTLVNTPSIFNMVIVVYSTNYNKAVQQS